MINLLLFTLLVPGSAFMLFAAYAMWKAFQASQSPEQPTAARCDNCGCDLTCNTSEKCPECQEPLKP